MWTDRQMARQRDRHNDANVAFCDFANASTTDWKRFKIFFRHKNSEKEHDRAITIG
jgi:hypothetical protein